MPLPRRRTSLSQPGASVAPSIRRQSIVRADQHKYCRIALAAVAGSWACDGANRVLDVPVIRVMIGEGGHVYSDNGRIAGIFCSRGGNQVEARLMKSRIPI